MPSSQKVFNFLTIIEGINNYIFVLHSALIKKNCHLLSMDQKIDENKYILITFFFLTMNVLQSY